MAGTIGLKERTLQTLTSTGASLTNGSAASAGTDLDARFLVAGNAQGDFEAIFELTCQWATVTGITLNTTVAELYLVPKLDGTNLSADLDLTAGSSALPYSTLVAPFIAIKAPTASTNARFVTNGVPLRPLLYTPYLKDTSGQTIAVNWTLKVIGIQGQYA